MLRPFAHPVAYCCTLSRVVGSCCAKFETGQTFSHVQTDVLTPNNVGTTTTTPNNLLSYRSGFSSLEAMRNTVLCKLYKATKGS